MPGPYGLKDWRPTQPLDEGGEGLLDRPTVGNLGRSAVIGGPIPVPPPATPGIFRFVDKEILINTTGSDNRAQMVTVALCIDDAVPDDPAFPIASDPTAFAIVEWGVGGVQCKAEVDFIQGTLLAVQCSFLRVTAVYEGFFPGGPNPPTPILVRAFVGYEPHASAEPAQRTLRHMPPAAPIAPGSFVDFRVPEFASSVEFFTATGPPFIGAAYTLLFFPFHSTAAPAYAIPVVATDRSSGRIEIANDIRRIRLLNTGGVAITSVRAVYSLTL